MTSSLWEVKKGMSSWISAFSQFSITVLGLKWWFRHEILDKILEHQMGIKAFVTFHHNHQTVSNYKLRKTMTQTSIPFVFNKH